MTAEYALSELAQRFKLKIMGDGDVAIRGICSLADGRKHAIAALFDKGYREHLQQTQAAAVIVSEDFADDLQVPALISENPQVSFARIAALFDPKSDRIEGVHPSASISPDAQIDPTAGIAAQVVVEAGAKIGARVQVNAGTVIGRNCEIGSDTRLMANVSLDDRVVLGQRVTIEPGAAIGGRGFGLARDGDQWLEVPQLGRVVIGDDVEIGANCTIDRGAIADTVIGNGVKIDSHCHIGHNCVIGEHTVVAGCSGVAGSVIIGKNCMLAGAVGVADNLSICDNVIVTGKSMVTRDISEPGMYSSGWAVMPAGEWRKKVAVFRRIDKLDARIKTLERADNAGET